MSAKITEEQIDKSIDDIKDDKKKEIEIEKEMVHEMSKIKVQLGWLGKVVGSRENADLNIVAITIVLGFILIVAIIFFIGFVGIKDPAREALNTMLLFLTSITTLAFGYLFGIKKSS